MAALGIGVNAALFDQHRLATGVVAEVHVASANGRTGPVDRVF